MLKKSLIAIIAMTFCAWLSISANASELKEACVKYQRADYSWSHDYKVKAFIGPRLFFVGFIKSHLSNLNLFKPQGLIIISSKAPRGIHNFQEEVLRVRYAITSSSNCFNQLNRALTFS